jgi:hypothetical protein
VPSLQLYFGLVHLAQVVPRIVVRDPKLAHFVIVLRPIGSLRPSGSILSHLLLVRVMLALFGNWMHVSLVTKG